MTEKYLHHNSHSILSFIKKFRLFYFSSYQRPRPHASFSERIKSIYEILNLLGSFILHVTPQGTEIWYNAKVHYAYASLLQGRFFIKFSDFKMFISNKQDNYSP